MVIFYLLSIMAMNPLFNHDLEKSTEEQFFATAIVGVIELDKEWMESFSLLTGCIN